MPGDVVGEIEEILADRDPAMRRLAIDELLGAVERLSPPALVALLLRGIADPARQVRDAACAALVAIEAGRPEDGGRVRRHLVGSARRAVDEAAGLGPAEVARHVRAMAALPLDDPDWLLAALVACLTLLEQARRDGPTASDPALLALLGQLSPSALWETVRAGVDGELAIAVLAGLAVLPAWTWQDVATASGQSRREVAAVNALVRARVRAGTAVPVAATAALTEAVARLAGSSDPRDRVAAVEIAGADSWPLLETASWDADAAVRSAVKHQLERMIATGQDVDRAWRMIDRLASG